MIPLTTRQARTAQWLLDQTGPRSAADAARELRLTPRMVRSGLDGVASFLERFDVAMERRPGVGVWLHGTEDALAQAREAIASFSGEVVGVYTPRVRLHMMLFELLIRSPEPYTLDQLKTRSEVSSTSARRDLRGAEEWLANQELVVARRPGVGVLVVGAEAAVRRALVKLLLETVPARQMAGGVVPETWFMSPEISSGVRDILRQFPIPECHAIVSQYDVSVQEGRVWLPADLAVLVHRVRNGRDLTLEPGVLRSLVDHGVWETAASLASELNTMIGRPLSESETGGIAERLLGAAQLSTTQIAPDHTDAKLSGEAVAIAAKELHPGLAEDDELLASLTDHIRRLRVRMKYGLPVHNPLLREVSDRYPEVHDVSAKIADYVGTSLGQAISEDEAGFVTMYLSGALERFRLKPRPRAIVVCPSGIATAWILVSRIQAEFPEIDIVEVLSAESADQAPIEDVELVISTVPLVDAPEGPEVLVVGPLLPSSDVRRLARAM